MISLGHQITAICPVQTTTLDHGKVGNLSTHKYLLVNPSKEVIISRVRFIDYRCTFGIAVIHNHIHFISFEVIG